MITSIAWKNVWRNRTRSLTVIAAVTVGVFAGVFSMAAINSSVVQRIDSAVNEELSHIQINNRDFRQSGDGPGEKRRRPAGLAGLQSGFQGFHPGRL